MADNSLLQIIDKTIDKSDPTQRAIGLLAALVDNKFNEIDKTLLLMKRQIDDQDENIEKIDHSHRCPFNMEQKVENLNAKLVKDIAAINSAIQPLTFLDRYPKMALLMVIGLIALCSLGIERLIDFLK